MKKSELECGNVVELRNGLKFLFLDRHKSLVELTGVGCTDIDYYDENLTRSSRQESYDIMKVYKDYTLTELLWERKETPKLTEDEKVILRNVNKTFKWITRDADDTLSFHCVKPHKEAYFWSSLGANYVSDLFPNLFQFIKWEDDEPYSIEELLKGEEK